MPTPMRHLTLPATALAAGAAVLLAGCGSSATTTTTPPATTQPQQDDAANSGASSEAVGSASDAGTSQLYSGGTAAFEMLNPRNVVAWQPPVQTGVMHDGPSPLAALLVKSEDATPTPLAISGSITAGVNFGGANCSGTFPCEIDTGGALAGGFYHVALTFDASHTMTVHTENGDTAVINGGELDLYVKGTTVSADGHGDWDYVIDVYSTMPTANPIVVNVTTANGGSWTTRVTGLRHGHREYVRTTNGLVGASSVITLNEGFRIDGDFSGFPTGATVADPGNGPVLLDHGNASQVFTKWTFNSVGVAGGTHTFVWDRFATFGLDYVRTGGTALTVSVTAPVENIYISKDGNTPVGPLDLNALKTQYNITANLTASAANY